MSDLTKNIVVCGDLVWDTHIARLPSDPKGYFQPHLKSQLTNRRGGAWYLHDVIQQAFAAALEEAKAVARMRERQRDEILSGLQPPPAPSDRENLESQVEEARKRVRQIEAGAQLYAPNPAAHVDIEEDKGDSGGVAKGFSVWEWFRDAWRIKEFLGCQAAKWPGEKGGPRSCPTIASLPAAADLLVIDDIGLGFADHSDCWPARLFDSGTPILVKATPPFDRAIWKKLLSSARAPRVSVVVAAAALRDAGAQLSRGFSWDQTILEVKKEFAPGGVAWALRECHRVVVPFGRSGASVFSRVPRSPEEEERPPTHLQFERFVYDPQHLEETWSTALPGITFGTTSIMTAAIAAQMLLNPSASSHRMVSRGLAAARGLHRIGGGQQETGFDLQAADKKAFHVDLNHLPENTFRSAFPRELLDRPVLVKPEDLPPDEDQTLLTDALGLTRAFLTVAAQDIVRCGRERPLESVPRLQYGKYFTVDREEIERLNTVRNLILDYQCNLADTRPLSIAVFGPPGAGKGFAIQELSESLFGKDRAVLEFNLSQFENLHALHEAFHEVRDKSVQGKLPLVFWDEFDSMRDVTPLGWLKEFLAPMQDARFVANGKAHPFGKCIFIFAGGTCGTFEDFIRPIESDARPKGQKERARKGRRLSDGAVRHFKSIKGADFVSRLRGYVNIKGPNPTSERADAVHVIRRALMLRHLIDRHHKELIHPVTGQLVISPTVLDAFLGVGDGKPGKGYRHGARSMEAIISLSRLRGNRHFGPSELPGREVLDQHVTPDFIDKVENKAQYLLTRADLEQLAAKKQDFWMQEKKSQGFIFGFVRDDKSKPPTHPLLKPYSELDENAKEGNRLPARLTPLRLESLGYHIRLADSPGGDTVVAKESIPIEILARSEHRRWMREKLLIGYVWARDSNDSLLLHKDIRPFKNLEKRESRLDHGIIQAVCEFLVERGLVLVKIAPHSKKNKTKS